MLIRGDGDAMLRDALLLWPMLVLDLLAAVHVPGAEDVLLWCERREGER